MVVLVKRLASEGGLTSIEPATVTLQPDLGRRREVFEAMDPLIAPRLRALLPPWLAFLPVHDGLTVYDSVAPAWPSCGGHWSIAAFRIGWLTHASWSFTLYVDFDVQDRPERLRVRGSGLVESNDLSRSGIERLLIEASRMGPHYSFVPHALTGISL